MFAICDDGDISVVVCVGRDWQIGFRRMLGFEECEEWRELQNLLQQFVMTDTNDFVLGFIPH
jgi:hypothetical protein